MIHYILTLVNKNCTTLKRDCAFFNHFKFTRFIFCRLCRFAGFAVSPVLPVLAVSPALPFIGGITHCRFNEGFKKPSRKG